MQTGVAGAIPAQAGGGQRAGSEREKVNGRYTGRWIATGRNAAERQARFDNNAQLRGERRAQRAAGAGIAGGIRHRQALLEEARRGAAGRGAA